MCSVRSPPSCMPTSTPSTRPSSSATTPGSATEPVAVGGGVVLAASYEAKAPGREHTRWAAGRPARCARTWWWSVRGSTPTSRRARPSSSCSARPLPWSRACPVDEAFLDVAGCTGSTCRPSRSVRACAPGSRDEVGLPITVGVARTPFLAKVASRVAKPDGLLLVPPDGEVAFLHPLPVELLWGVGDVTARKLHGTGVATAGDVAASGRPPCSSAPSARGRETSVRGGARARPLRGWSVGKSRGSIGAQRAIGHGPQAPGEFVRAALLGLVDRVCRRLRKANRVGADRRAAAALRGLARRRRGRARSRSRPTPRRADRSAAVALLAAAAPLVRERGITLVGVAVGGLESDAFRPARAAARPTPTAAARRRGRRGRGAVRDGRRWCARACSAAARASRCRCCPTEPAAVPVSPDTREGSARRRGRGRRRRGCGCGGSSDSAPTTTAPTSTTRLTTTTTAGTTTTTITAPAVESVIDIGGTQLLGMTVTSDTMSAISFDAGTITRVDPTTNTVTASFDVPGAASALAVNGVVWVASYGGPRSLVAIDSTDGALRASVEAGELCCDLTTDGTDVGDRSRRAALADRRRRGRPCRPRRRGRAQRPHERRLHGREPVGVERYDAAASDRSCDRGDDRRRRRRRRAVPRARRAGVGRLPHRDLGGRSGDGSGRRADRASTDRPRCSPSTSTPRTMCGSASVGPDESAPCCSSTEPPAP